MKNAALIIIGAGLGAAATFGAFCGGFISGASVFAYGAELRSGNEKQQVHEKPSEDTEE